jgi:hypothetical protein
MEAQVGQFLLGYKCPVSRDIVMQEHDPLGDHHAAFFHQNRGDNFLNGFLHSEFWGEVSRYDTTSLIVALLLCLPVIVI